MKKTKSPFRRLLSLLPSLLLSGSFLTLTTSCTEADLDRMAYATEENLHLSWEVLENFHDSTYTVKCAFVLENRGTAMLPDSGWSIYFNFCRAILPQTADLNEHFAFEHINGDFFRCYPTAGFPGLAPGEKVNITYIADAWVTTRYEAPDHPFIVRDGNDAASLVHYNIKPFDRPEQTTRCKEDVLPVADAAFRYQRNQHLTLLPRTDLPPCLPTPAHYNWGDPAQTLLIEKEIEIQTQEGLENEAEAAAAIFAAVGLQTKTTQEKKAVQAASLTPTKDPSTYQPNLLSLRVNPTQNREGYQLDVTPNKGITITGGSPAGVFYGLQTLRALLPLGAYDQQLGTIFLRPINIQDTPRFAFRGMLLDVARNFQQKESVLRLLDLMALYKLNTFHFHLTDDEGWRLAIPGLPELTAVGSRRGFGQNEAEHLLPAYGSGPFADAPNNHGSGHYSKADFIEILRYAKKLHIAVIPEIDMPGHAHAAIAAMKARTRKLLAAGDSASALQYALTDPQDKSVYKSVQMYNDNVICPCQPSTYRFLTKVVDEVLAMYQDAGVQLKTLHIGGDEVPEGVWRQSPHCQAQFGAVDSLNYENILYRHFVDQFSNLLAERGIRTAGWEEITTVITKKPVRDAQGQITGYQKEHLPNPTFVNKGLQGNIWNNIWEWGGASWGYDIANAGYPTVLSNATNLYFDLCHDKHPVEPGYYWAAYVNTRNVFEFTPSQVYHAAYTDRMGNELPADKWQEATQLDATGREQLLGIQGQLWSETVKGEADMLYRVLPRLIALGQRSWSPQPDWAGISDLQERRQATDQAWNQFANAVGQQALPLLDRLFEDVNYRIPPPGVQVIDGFLHCNVAFPGLQVYYTIDGSEPSTSAQHFEAPITYQDQLTYTFKAFSSECASRAVVKGRSR